MGVKGLAKCSFVYCKRKDAVIILIMHCFHPLISEEHWLGSFVNTGHKGWNNIHGKQILHIGNKHDYDASNEAFELPQSLSNQIIRSHIKPITPLRKNKKVEALTRIIDLIEKQGLPRNRKNIHDNETSGNPGILSEFSWDC